jgi:aminoglycoside 2'-N-acetyltransferase I
MTAELRTSHTADLTDADRAAMHRLLYDVFERMTPVAYDNALGGIHALLFDAGALIGHASVVQRRVMYDGRALRAGYVEAVAVHPDRRREGHGARLMSEIERVIESGYDLGALGASAQGAALYAARGWQLWRGPSAALTPEGVRPTPDKDGAIHVFPVTLELDLSAQLICDWRPGALW